MKVVVQIGQASPDESAAMAEMLAKVNEASDPPYASMEEKFADSIKHELEHRAALIAKKRFDNTEPIIESLAALPAPQRLAVIDVLISSAKNFGQNTADLVKVRKSME